MSHLPSTIGPGIAAHFPRVHPRKLPRANSFPVEDGVGKLRGPADLDVDWWIWSDFSPPLARKPQDLVSIAELRQGIMNYSMQLGGYHAAVVRNV